MFIKLEISDEQARVHKHSFHDIICSINIWKSMLDTGGQKLQDEQGIVPHNYFTIILASCANVWYAEESL